MSNNLSRGILSKIILLSKTTFSILLGIISNPGEMLIIVSSIVASLFKISIKTGRASASIPLESVKLPCGSASTINTLAPYVLAQAPILSTVVVFPVPPFTSSTAILVVLNVLENRGWAIEKLIYAFFESV